MGILLKSDKDAGLQFSSTRGLVDSEGNDYERDVFLNDPKKPAQIQIDGWGEIFTPALRAPGKATRDALAVSQAVLDAGLTEEDVVGWIASMRSVDPQVGWRLFVEQVGWRLPDPLASRAGRKFFWEQWAV